jgi:hypothetical protein
MQGGNSKVHNDLEHYFRRTILPLAVGSRELLANSFGRTEINETTFSEYFAIIAADPNDNIGERKLVAEPSD